MDRFNYHHLHYFWVTAREGSVTRAAESLGVSQPTVSGQLRELELSIESPLFVKAGRGLILSETGQMVFRYADEIFSLGNELIGVLKGRPSDQPIRLRVGIVESVPKLMAHRLLEPALRLSEGVRVFCTEARLDKLTAELTIHNLDVVLSDTPIPSILKVKVFNHLLGESSVSIVGSPKMVAQYQAQFPQSLNQSPFLMPSENATLRRSLDHWFGTIGAHPEIRGEFDDSALMKIFAGAGEGLCAIPTVVENDAQSRYGLWRVGVVPTIRERFYAISIERKLKHPAVVAISEAARVNLESGSRADGKQPQ